MIQGIEYPHINEGFNNFQNYLEDQISEGLNEINQFSSELKNSNKKNSYELKHIKQLKSKDIKLSHKKFQIFPNKANPTIKIFTSFSKQRKRISDEKAYQQKLSDMESPSKSIKNKKTQNFEKLQGKQKQIETINPLNPTNPETFMSSKDSMMINRDKYNTKQKISEINSFQQRVRQSRSQSKKEKINRNNVHQNMIKSNLNAFQNSQTSIFQNLDFLTKNNSHHSLDKSQQFNIEIGLNPIMSFKIEEKLHLPSLVSNSGLKNMKNKVQQTIIVTHEHNQTSIEKSNFNAQNSKTQKSSPYIQKTVKIAIDRLKPLKPEQIKLKFQQRVKQEQKNRAKQIAIHMFEKEEEEAVLKNKQYNFRHDKSEEGRIDENENKRIGNEDRRMGNEDRRMGNEEFQQIRNKPSFAKRQKQPVNKKEQNIFKKN